MRKKKVMMRVWIGVDNREHIKILRISTSFVIKDIGSGSWANKVGSSIVYPVTDKIVN